MSTPPQVATVSPQVAAILAAQGIPLTPLAPLKRIKGHDCFEFQTRKSPRLFVCSECKVTWWLRNRLWWEVLDMECPCGARAWSEDTSIEWATDTECDKCWDARVKPELTRAGR